MAQDEELDPRNKGLAGLSVKLPSGRTTSDGEVAIPPLAAVSVRPSRPEEKDGAAVTAEVQLSPPECALQANS